MTTLNRTCTSQGDAHDSFTREGALQQPEWRSLASQQDCIGQAICVSPSQRRFGGQASEIEVKAFLSRGGQGPEHQALMEALARLDTLSRAEADQTEEKLSEEAVDKLSRVLGQAVARCWSSLPQAIQQNMFEAAVTSEGEAVRQELAVYLHGKHERAVNAAPAGAIPEPDSLGG
jgi:hypothetical protein